MSSEKKIVKKHIINKIAKHRNKKNPKFSKLAELNKTLRTTGETTLDKHIHSENCNHFKVADISWEEETLLPRKNGTKETQKQKNARQARNKTKKHNQKSVIIISIPKPSRKENRTLESTMKRSSVLNKKQAEGKVKLNKAKSDKEGLLIEKLEKQLKIGRSRLGKIDALRLKLLAAQEKYTNMLRAKHEARQK